MRAPTAQRFQLRERLVVQVLEGDSVAQALEDLRVAHGASRVEWTARGRVDAVRWTGGEAPERGTLDVISLTGSLTAEQRRLDLLGRALDGSLRGGGITDARAVELELSIDLLEAAAAEAEAPPAGAPTWAAVAAASAEAERAGADEEPPEVPLPRPGDRIDHAAFGECAVEKLEEDEDFVLVRGPAGRLLRLSLEVLRLELVGEEGGRRRYRVRPTKGRP